MHRKKGSYANETQAGPGSQYPHSSQRYTLCYGSIRVHSFCCWVEGKVGRCYLLASAAGSMTMVVVVAVLVETMGRMMVLVVVVNAYTGHPMWATVMVMVNNSREAQTPAIEESRPGLSDSVSLHVMFL